MKLDYLEMLHTEFEVSSSNSIAVREIITKQVQDLYRAGPRDIVLLFLRLVLQNCCIHAAAILHIIC